MTIEEVKNRMASIKELFKNVCPCDICESSTKHHRGLYACNKYDTVEARNQRCKPLGVFVDEYKDMIEEYKQGLERIEDDEEQAHEALLLKVASAVEKASQQTYHEGHHEVYDAEKVHEDTRYCADIRVRDLKKILESIPDNITLTFTSGGEWFDIKKITLDLYDDEGESGSLLFHAQQDSRIRIEHEESILATITENHDCKDVRLELRNYEERDTRGECTKWTPQTTTYFAQLYCPKCKTKIDVLFEYSFTEKIDCFDVIEYEEW